MNEDKNGSVKYPMLKNDLLKWAYKKQNLFVRNFFNILASLVQM